MHAKTSVLRFIPPPTPSFTPLSPLWKAHVPPEWALLNGSHQTLTPTPLAACCVPRAVMPSVTARSRRELVGRPQHLTRPSRFARGAPTRKIPISNQIIPDAWDECRSAGGLRCWHRSRHQPRAERKSCGFKATAEHSTAAIMASPRPARCRCPGLMILLFSQPGLMPTGSRHRFTEPARKATVVSATCRQPARSGSLEGEPAEARPGETYPRLSWSASSRCVTRRRPGWGFVCFSSDAASERRR